jgi:hypothetical protein
MVKKNFRKISRSVGYLIDTIVRFSLNYKKAGPKIQSPKLASRPIWQVKQRWARRFDLTRAKISIYKKTFLTNNGA